MELLKKAIRKSSINNSVHTVKDILEEFVERSDQEIQDFSGTLNELVLSQAVRILREKKSCGGPETAEEFDLLIEMVKSLKEVKDASKDVFYRAGNPAK